MNKIQIKLKKKETLIIPKIKLKLKLKNNDKSSSVEIKNASSSSGITDDNDINLRNLYDNGICNTENDIEMRKLNDYLDKNFLQYLMYVKDSWSEVKYKIRFDTENQECWWDLELLLKHFGEQLNVSTMSNPAPKWPFNPFTRQLFNRHQLMKLGLQIKKINFDAEDIIQEFFNFLEKYSNIDQFTFDFQSYLSQNYRYKLVNMTDSQENYVGYWVKKTEPLSLFEMRYNEFNSICPFIYDQRSRQLIANREYTFYKEILDSIQDN